MLDTSLYHLSLAAHSRSHGHSAAAKIAYVTAERITDLWTGKVHNYRRKQGVLRVGVVGFNGTPAELARLMDEAEKRRNSTVCREGIVGLPHGLPLELRWRLLHAHAEAMAKRWGVPVIATSATITGISCLRHGGSRAGSSRKRRESSMTRRPARPR